LDYFHVEFKFHIIFYARKLEACFFPGQVKVTISDLFTGLFFARPNQEKNRPFLKACRVRGPNLNPVLPDCEVAELLLLLVLPLLPVLPPLPPLPPLSSLAVSGVLPPPPI
jgi:hypothetical protein